MRATEKVRLAVGTRRLVTMQKTLIGIGVFLIVVGLLWPWIQRAGLGRLPGDIIVEKENFRFYFPLTTMAIVSVVVTVIFWLLRK